MEVTSGTASVLSSFPTCVDSCVWYRLQASQLCLICWFSVAVYVRLCVPCRWGKVGGLLETRAYTHTPASAAGLGGGNGTNARS